MIVEDAVNFQKQLVHLFRVFEVDALVSVGVIGDDDDCGVTVISADSQLKLTPVEAKKPKTRKKDVLSD